MRLCILFARAGLMIPGSNFCKLFLNLELMIRMPCVSTVHQSGSYNTKQQLLCHLFKNFKLEMMMRNGCLVFPLYNKVSLDAKQQFLPAFLKLELMMRNGCLVCPLYTSRRRPQFPLPILSQKDTRLFPKFFFLNVFSRRIIIFLNFFFRL